MVAENEDMRALDGVLTPEERLEDTFAEAEDLHDWVLEDEDPDPTNSDLTAQADKEYSLKCVAENYDPAGYCIPGRDMKARGIFYDAVKTLWVEFGFNYLNLSESRLSVLAESEDDKCLDDHWEVHAIWDRA